MSTEQMKYSQGRIYNKTRPVLKLSQVKISHVHVIRYVEELIKPSRFSGEFRTAANSLLVCSSKGHWQS